mmetsp:Transcript_52218/g.137891  ORF Transcript_52218/g.137891 Transcript_52218/m.137891 type:complete len:575 (-) Transcript_52218:171-1895(-)
MLHDDEGLVIRQQKAKLQEGLLELVHRDDAVVVLVELAEDVPHQGELLLHALAQLLEHRRQVERPLHARAANLCEVLPRVLVAIDEIERPVVDADARAREEVRGLEQVACHLVGVDGLLQEPARHDAAVAAGRLVDAQAVVLQEVVHDEHAVRILGLGVRDLRGEAEHHAVVLEELDKVLLRRLRAEHPHRAQRVVPRAVARVRGRRRPGHRALRQADVDGVGQIGVELRPVVLARERVGVVDEEVVAEHHRDVADAEVLALQALLPPDGVVQGPLDLAEAALDAGPLEEYRELVPAGVQRVLLPNLHRVVREVDADDEGPALKLRHRDVVHDRVEAANLAVPLHELLHVRVDVAAAQHHLRVVPFGGPGLDRLDVLARVERRHEAVLLERLAGRLLHALLRVVGPRPLVAVHNLDRPPVDVERDAATEVLPHQVAAVRAGEAMAADERALRDAAVLLLLLDYLAGVVLQVIEEGAVTHPVVFQVRLHDRLLEKAVEAQDVAVQGVVGGDLRDGVKVSAAVLVALAVLAVAQAAGAADLRHLVDQDHLRPLERDTLLVHNPDTADVLEALGLAI